MSHNGYTLYTLMPSMGPIGPIHSEAKFTLVTLVSVCSGAIMHLLTAAQAATFSWRIVQAGLAASYAPMLMS